MRFRFGTCIMRYLHNFDLSLALFCTWICSWNPYHFLIILIFKTELLAYCYNSFVLWSRLLCASCICTSRKWIELCISDTTIVIKIVKIFWKFFLKLNSFIQIYLWRPKIFLIIKKVYRNVFINLIFKKIGLVLYWLKWFVRYNIYLFLLILKYSAAIFLIIWLIVLILW